MPFHALMQTHQQRQANMGSRKSPKNNHFAKSPGFGHRLGNSWPSEKG